MLSIHIYAPHRSRNQPKGKNIWSSNFFFLLCAWFVRWEGWNNNAAGKELWKFHYIYGKKGTLDIGFGIHFYTGPKAYMCDTGIQ